MIVSGFYVLVFIEEVVSLHGDAVLEVSKLKVKVGHLNITEDLAVGSMLLSMTLTVNKKMTAPQQGWLFSLPSAVLPSISL